MTLKNTLQPHLEWIGGKRSCLQVINNAPHTVRRIMITHATQERLNITPPPSCALSLATQDEIAKVMADCNHQGIAILVQPSYLETLDNVLKTTPEQATFLAIDTIQDPHNLGAICRCAAAFSVNTIFITKRSMPGGTHWKKVASGALMHVRICPVTNMKNTLDSLKTQGFWCVGLAEEGDNQTHNIQTPRIVYVLGGEEKGIRPLVRKSCDTLMCVATNPAFTTLNMSHACAVVLSQRFLSNKTK